MALLSIITIELVGLEKLTPAFGLVMMFMGVMATVASPIGGMYKQGLSKHTAIVDTEDVTIEIIKYMTMSPVNDNSNNLPHNMLYSTCSSSVHFSILNLITGDISLLLLICLLSLRIDP